MDEFLSSIHLPFLTWEENICRWLYEYEACTVEEIAGFLGKPESDISRILRSRYQKYHEGVAFKPGKKMLLVKNRDDPHRKILLRVDGYPEKKLGRGRPGKYELRKDYNFLRKYLRKQGKLN